jgi:hypothetical protein
MSRSCLARVVIVVGLLVDGVAAQACVGQAYSDAGYARCAGENGGACPHPWHHSFAIVVVCVSRGVVHGIYLGTYLVVCKAAWRAALTPTFGVCANVE